MKAIKLRCYCNHCDTHFIDDGQGETDATVCPHCGVSVFTRFGTMTHPANKSMSVTKAKEIISWLGWRDFKIAQPGFAADHPKLRPIKKVKS